MTRYSSRRFTVLSNDGRVRSLPVPDFGPHAFGSLTRLTLDPEAQGLPFMGFGASLTEASAWNIMRMDPEARQALLQRLFGPGGPRLDILRLNVGASDYSLDPYSYAEVADDRALAHFSIARDERWLIPLLQEILAIRPDLFIFSSPWSPPGWMKTGGEMAGGWMRAEYLETFANYYAKYLAAYRAHGIPIRALTCQNEVETDQLSRMPASLLHPEYEMRLVAELLPRALADHGLDDVELWLHDHNYVHWRRIDWMLADEAVRARTAGIAVHPYEGTAAMLDPVAARHPELPFHLTEVGPGLGPDYDADVCRWGELISDALRHHCVSFTSWNLALDEEGRPNIGPFSCAGLVTIDSQDASVTLSSLYRAFAFMRAGLPLGARVIASGHSQAQSRDARMQPGSRPEVPAYVAVRTDERIHLLLTNSGPRHDFELGIEGSLLRLEVPGQAISHLEIAVADGRD